MAFPQIGLQAVLVLQRFQANAKKYDATLKRMQAQTKKTARTIKQSTSKMGDEFQGLRDGIAQNVAAMGAAEAGAASLSMAFPIVAAAALGVATAVAKVSSAMYEMAETTAPLVDARRSFTALAASYGVAADEILAGLQRVSRGTIDTATLIRISNRALMAGGAEMAGHLEELYLIAEAGARATGVSVTYAFDMLVKGIVKGSPKLIDEAEIYLKLGNAVDEYAASLGLTTEQLSAHQQIQATLYGVLEKGAPMVERFGDQVAALADPFRQADVAARQFKTGISELLIPAMQQVAKTKMFWVQTATLLTATLAALYDTWFQANAILRGQTTVVEVYNEKFQETMRILSGGIPKSEQAAVAIQDIGTAAQESAKQTEELNKKLTDLAEKRAEKLANLEIQFTQRWQDIEIQRARQIEDARRRLSYKLEDQARDYADRVADIHADHSENLQDIEADKQKRLAEFAKDANKARQDLERQHLDRLQAIQQSYYDTVDEAARSNDAVSIVRAMRQQARELRDAEQAKSKEQTQLSEDLAEKQEQLTTALNEERAAEQERYREALTAAEEQQQKQIETLQRSLARQQEDRAIAWRRQEEDYERAKQRQLEAIDRWYAIEEEKLSTHLGKMGAVAAQGITQAGAQIAGAASQAAVAVAVASTIGLTEAQQWQQRHTYLMAEGGTMVVDRPTHFIAGEAGPEVAMFAPIQQGSLTHNFGGLDVNFNGLPAQMESNVESMMYSAIVQLAQRLARGAK